MKYTRTAQAAAIASIAAMALSACGSSNSGGDVANATLDPNAKVEISFAGWSLNSTPEFQTLVDAFEKENPNITVKIKEYSADDYDKQLTTDLSGGTAPEVFPIKNLQKYYTYAVESQGLADLSSIADTYKNDKNIDISQYNLDGKYYAMPYRQDSWVLFYNKTMFEKAGVAIPDGTWTWDDYMKTAEELKTKLPAAGYDANSVYPTYHHTSWQSVTQSFTTAQSAATVDGAKKNFLSGDYSYMADMYKNVFLKAQDENLTVNYNTVTANKVQYQAQFGTEKAAMLPMGTWYAATLVSQQKSGDANKFEWGMAPIPQSSSVKSSDGKPITFADPTGLAISAGASGDKLAAAKKFVEFASGEKGAEALAAISTTPAYFSDNVVKTYFGVEGMANDDQSKKAWQEHDTRPENYVDKATNDVQGILKTMMSTIMTETGTVDQAIQKANDDIASQGILK